MNRLTCYNDTRKIKQSVKLTTINGYDEAVNEGRVNLVLNTCDNSLITM
jgi:hypothetical protein